MATATTRDVTRDRFVAPIPLADAPNVRAALDRLGFGSLSADGLSGVVGRNENWVGRTADGRDVFVKHLVGSAVDCAARYDRALTFERIAADRPFRTWL